MKFFLMLATLLTAVSPTEDPLVDLYLRQYLGVKVVPNKISKNFFHRQVEFNTKFINCNGLEKVILKFLCLLKTRI